MNIIRPARPKPPGNQLRLLILSIIFSLGLHLLLVFIPPLLQQQDKVQLWQQSPTIVHLVDIPKQTEKIQQEKPRDFEIDQQPVIQQPEIPVESFRKADQDQKVDLEQAPKGEDARDQTIKQPLPAPPARQRQKNQDQLVQKRSQKNDQKPPEPIQEKMFKHTSRAPSQSVATLSAQPEVPPPVFSPEQLRPDSSTLEKIVQGSQADRNRTKKRKDIEKIGDTVWLNLQHNLLISFFRRFHDQIEMVWNYPTQAAENGIEGILELLIIVNQKGELLDVIPQRSSGSDLLDFEAIQAVYRAAPFGPLTKHYPHEKLKIHAYFSYSIAGQYIYGRRK